MAAVATRRVAAAAVLERAAASGGDGSICSCVGTNISRWINLMQWFAQKKNPNAVVQASFICPAGPGTLGWAHIQFDAGGSLAAA